MKMRSTSRGQGREGDRSPGGAGAKQRQPARMAARRVAKPATLCENHEPMNKNLIEPERSGDSRRQRRSDLVSWHNTPKASGMPLEVNAAAVRQSNVPLPEEWERSGHSLPQAARRASEARQIRSERSGQKSAEPRDEVASRRLPRRGERRETARSNP